MHSPIPWMGAKRRLASRILSKMPPHTCYVELFAGGASVLFMRDEPAKVEVLNDIDGELANFFRVLKHHVIEFCNQFRYAVVSRQIFDWLQMTPEEVLTDIQRAARFYYLQKLCFGGVPHGRSFGTATTSKPKLNFVRLEEDLSQVHARLINVFIEHLDWIECLNRYDRAHTLFFIDPPYWKLTGYKSGRNFDLDQYRKIAEAMRTMKGKALLTINDHADMKRVFAGFKHSRLDVNYTVGGAKRTKPARELIYRSWR